MVFDIDETALSNWEAIKANDFGRVIDGPCDELPRAVRLAGWDLRAQSTVIAADDGRLQHREGPRRGDLLHHRPRRVPARGDRTQPAAVGYTGYTRLIMEPPGAHYVSAADFKAPQRQAIEQEGYTIIANVGDQPSDLDGGFSERDVPAAEPVLPHSLIRPNGRLGGKVRDAKRRSRSYATEACCDAAACAVKSSWRS